MFTSYSYIYKVVFCASERSADSGDKLGLFGDDDDYNWCHFAKGIYRIYTTESSVA